MIFNTKSISCPPQNVQYIKTKGTSPHTNVFHPKGLYHDKFTLKSLRGGNIDKERFSFCLYPYSLFTDIFEFFYTMLHIYITAFLNNFVYTIIIEVKPKIFDLVLHDAQKPSSSMLLKSTLEVL